MNSKYELKNIFYNRLHNKNKSKLSNSNTISSSNINNSYNSFDKSKKANISTSLYYKPRPIYIIPNKNEKNNICINKHNPIKPKELETYEVDYSNGNITMTRINTERNKNNFSKITNIKEYNNIYNNNKYKSLKKNSYEFKHINDDILNIRNYFNYKYEQIKKNFKLDRLNTYNYSNSTIMKNNNNTEDNFGEKYQGKKIKNNTIYRLKYLNSSSNSNVMKLKSSKSTDIIRMCKVLKGLDNREKGTLIRDKDEGGIIDFNKDNLKAQKQNYIINYKKIVLIQKWWKKLKYKKYLIKCVIIIQKNYRGYIFRKTIINYIKSNNLKKIIFIQECWKRHLMNISQKNLNFSFTSTDTNINIINNNGVIRIGNKNSDNNNNEINSKKSNNSFNIPYKNKENQCIITKKYHTNTKQKINNINSIKINYKKYSSLKNQNPSRNQDGNKAIVYFKKNLHNNKPNKSRNKKNHVIKSNVCKLQMNSNNTPLPFISDENYFYSHSYNTPKKGKNKQNSYPYKEKEKESTYSAMFYKINCKEIFSRYNTNTHKNTRKNENETKNIMKKKLNYICYISKSKKEINLLNKIIYLQKEIKNFLCKKNYYIINIKKICYISKQSFSIKDLLKKKTILIQRNIKKYLYNRNHKTSKISKNYTFSDNKYSLTNDISDEKKYNDSNTNKKNISEFNIKENENNDFILVENNTKLDNNDNNNANTFISKNVTTFSFDFKNHDDYNTNRNINLNLDINDNTENIQDEDDDNIIINNNVNNINNYFSFSSKNILLANERYNSCYNLRNIFVGFITNKFSIFLILLLDRLNLFDFIKIFSQKIKKSINQYVFFTIKSEIFYNKNELFFFSTLKRHIWYNIYINKEDNEIKRILKENIPKLFKINDINLECDSYNRINIPYINNYQENHLINRKLFINNNRDLIKYFIGFYNNNKHNHLKLDEIKLKNILDKNNIINRNIFGITKYMDNIIYNKLFIYNKQNIYSKIKIKQAYKKNISFDEINNNDIFFKGIDEDIDDKSIGKNSVNKTLIINNNLFNNNCYTLNQSNYKFIDYLNEKSKNNHFNETMPATSREFFDNQINDNV